MFYLVNAHPSHLPSFSPNPHPSHSTLTLHIQPSPFTLNPHPSHPTLSIHTHPLLFILPLTLHTHPSPSTYPHPSLTLTLHIHPSAFTPTLTLHTHPHPSHPTLTIHTHPSPFTLTPCPLHSTPATLLGQVCDLKSAVTHLWFIHTYIRTYVCTVKHSSQMQRIIASRC